MCPSTSKRVTTSMGTQLLSFFLEEEASSPFTVCLRGSGNLKFSSPLAGEGKGEGAHLHHTPSPLSPPVEGGESVDNPHFERRGNGRAVSHGPGTRSEPVEGSQEQVTRDPFMRNRNGAQSIRARRHTALLPVLILSSLVLHFCPIPPAHSYMDTERSVKLDAPFLPTPNYVIAEILAKARVGKDDILYDLGSGDGRIVIEAARQTGCRAVGIELDADLVDESRKAAVRAGVQDRVRFIVADIFTEDFSEATVVTLYMGGHVNRKIRPRLLGELRPGTRIASYTFDMGDWKPDETSTFGREDAYFWVIPANFSGRWQWAEGKGKSKTAWELEVKQVFQEITGEISYRGRKYPVMGGKITGERIRFMLAGEPFGKSAPVQFSGRIREHAIEGEILHGTARRPWKATRNPSTVQPIAR